MKTKKEIGEEGNEGIPLGNYPATCKSTSSRCGKGVANAGELIHMLVAGVDNDKFEIITFSNPKVRRSGSPLLRFYEAVFFVLSAAGIGDNTTAALR